MRLWHKYLIEVLPRQQLLGQWRECCLIAKNIEEKGQPNHILVNKIMDYPIEHFIFYAKLVRDEMIKRGYKCNGWNFEKHLQNENFTVTMSKDELFNAWHDSVYLAICYYNLSEKYMCGGISRDEFNSIYDQCIYVLNTLEQNKIVL